MSDTIIYVLPHLGAISFRGLLRSAKVASYLGAHIFLINFLISARVASNGSVPSFAANWQTCVHKTSWCRFYQHYFLTHLPISLVLE